MKLGAYAVNLEGPLSLCYNLVDSARVNLLGIPRLPGGTPAEIAAQALRNNARGVLHAGSGHFKFMWVSDFAKALRGAWDVLGAEYLGRQIDYMTEESARLGRVTSCFTPSHGFDMPWHRGDNLPWLIFCHASRGGVSDRHRGILQKLLDDYEENSMHDGLVAPHVTGDWVDTVLRPSSTYNNVCALYMLKWAPTLGLKTRHDAAMMERTLLRARLRGDILLDYQGAGHMSVDGAVAALYLDVFEPDVQKLLIRGLEKSGLAEPYPIRVAQAKHDPKLVPLLTNFTPSYHTSIWLHLGLMYLNGLKRNKHDIGDRLARIEALIMRHGQVLEAVDDKGDPYRTVFLSCEHGLSMAAGQYLELLK